MNWRNFAEIPQLMDWHTWSIGNNIISFHFTNNRTTPVACSKLSLLAKAFWVIWVVMMFAFGSMLVNEMRIFWDENPTQLKTDTR